MRIVIPVSMGELIDKISILEIKSTFTDNEFVLNELNKLNQIKSMVIEYPKEHEIALKKVNRKLWDIEDKLRKLEKEQDFGWEFVQLARQVYTNNDIRADLKRRINEETDSDFKEVKIY